MGRAVQEPQRLSLPRRSRSPWKVRSSVLLLRATSVTWVFPVEDMQGALSSDLGFGSAVGDHASPPAAAPGALTAVHCCAQLISQRAFLPHVCAVGGAPAGIGVSSNQTAQCVCGTCCGVLLMMGPGVLVTITFPKWQAQP